MDRKQNALDSASSRYYTGNTLDRFIYVVAPEAIVVVLVIILEEETKQWQHLGEHSSKGPERQPQ
jgi:hypothetical protein